MRIGYTAIGIAVLASAGCHLRPSPASAPPVTVTVTAAPSVAAEATPTSEPTIAEFVQMPDLAHRPLDVAEYLLEIRGLGHSIVGPDQYDYDATQLRVCSTLPRAGTTVRSGTRIALVVRWMNCRTL